MAQGEDPLDQTTGTGAAVFGLIGSLLIWLTIGAGAVAKYAWLGVGLALMLGMKYLPAPAAQPLILVCRRVGTAVWAVVATLFLLAPGALERATAISVPLIAPPVEKKTTMYE